MHMLRPVMYPSYESNIAKSASNERTMSRSGYTIMNGVQVRELAYWAFQGNMFIAFVTLDGKEAGVGKRDM